MPLKLKISDVDDTTVIVWETLEEPHFFEQALEIGNEQKQQLEPKSKKQKLEWLSTRYLIKLYLPDFLLENLTKDKYGKPYINNSDKFISISHSHSFASVIISRNVVGIDIQKIHPKIDRISHKFINPEEFEFIEDQDKLTHMHIIWGAKESMYKGYGKKELRFKEHMSVKPYSLQLGTTSFRGNVCKEDVKQSYILKTRAINDYILVYAIKK